MYTFNFPHWSNPLELLPCETHVEVWWYTSYICLEYSLPSGAWKAFTVQMGATEKLKKIKISISLLMIPCFGINILIPASHKFFQRLQKHWHLKNLVSLCDHKSVHVDSEKSWSLMNGLSKYRAKLLPFPVISDLLPMIYTWNQSGKSLQLACLFTTVHSTWFFH